jgi:Fe-S cluster biogenesis protein NfuA
MFIQTEATPNPSTLKFIPGRVVMESGTFECRSQQEAERSPLALALFSIDNIEAVFFGHDFISVTKKDSEWQNLKPSILGIMMQHFTSGQPILTSLDKQENDDFIGDEHDAIINQINELIETRVRPAVAGDGGDIVLRGFKDGIVYLKMKGACSGCPSSTATLKNGIQNLLRHYIPEVQSVEQI